MSVEKWSLRELSDKDDNSMNLHQVKTMANRASVFVNLMSHCCTSRHCVQMCLRDINRHISVSKVSKSRVITALWYVVTVTCKCCNINASY